MGPMNVVELLKKREPISQEQGQNTREHQIHLESKSLHRRAGYKNEIHKFDRTRLQCYACRCLSASAKRMKKHNKLNLLVTSRT